MKKQFSVVLLAALFMLGIMFSSATPLVGTTWAETPPPLMWSQTYDSGYPNGVGGVATDHSDNIIVVGYSENISANRDWLIRKYNPTGDTLLWSQTYDGGYDDSAYGVAVDADNNVIVAGDTDNAGNLDCMIRKYNAAGDLQWSKTIDTGAEYDWPGLVAVDGNNDIIVVSTADWGTESDWLISKYNPAGELLWSEPYSIGYWGWCWGVAVDSDNNIAVSGTTDDGTNANWLTLKYNSAGVLQWSEPYDSGNWDGAGVITVDNSNNIVVVGTVSNGIDDDYLIRKYTPNGGLIWEQPYDGGASYDYINGVAVDTDNNIIVAGWISDGNVDDWLIHKYDSAGTMLWEMTYDAGMWDYNTTVALDSSGNIIAASSTRFDDITDDNWLINKYGELSSTTVIANSDNPVPQVGDTICVSVNIADVSNLYAASFDMLYDSMVLSYQGATEGSFLSSNGQYTTSMLEASSAGQIIVGISRLGDVGGMSGSGTLATLCFTVIGDYCSASDISFVNAYLEGPAQGSLISATWNGTTIDVMLAVPSNPATSDPGLHDQLDLSWGAVSGADSYDVYRSNTSGGTYNLVGTVSSNSYQDSSCIIPTLDYYYQVKAISDTCESEFSIEVSGFAAGLLGDINNDGRVDGRDLSRLARAFGSANDCQADLDRTDLTDGDDLSILAANFGRTL